MLIMYVICVYDVKSKHCSKFMKLLRRYLFHIQESVFEGELTPAQYQKLDKELNEILTADDCVILFYSYNNKAIKKKVMGNAESSMQII